MGTYVNKFFYSISKLKLYPPVYNVLHSHHISDCKFIPLQHLFHANLFAIYQSILVKLSPFPGHIMSCQFFFETVISICQNQIGRIYSPPPVQRQTWFALIEQVFSFLFDFPLQLPPTKNVSFFSACIGIATLSILLYFW